MELPALSIRQPNVGRTLMQMAMLKSEKSRNNLLQAKERKRAGYENALAQLQGQGQPGDDALKGGASTGTPGNIDLSGPAARQLAIDYPEMSKPLFESWSKLNENERAKEEHDTKTLGTLLIGIDTLPEGLARQEAYSRILDQAEKMGVDLAGVSDKYDKARVDGRIRLATGIGKFIDEQRAQGAPRSPAGKTAYDVKQGHLTPEQGQTALAGKPAAVTPHTDIAKARADFRSGLMTEAELASAISDAKVKGVGKEAFANADKLRDEFHALTKDFRGARDAYARVVASAEDPSPAGDLSLIFNYMKVLDPGSVVRESEFATAAASGSFGESIQAAAQRVMSGERLSDNMRRDFANRAERLYKKQESLMEQTAGEYRTLAGRFDVDPKSVVLESRYNPGDGGAPAAPQAPVAAASVAGNPDEARRLKEKYGLD